MKLFTSITDPSNITESNIITINKLASIVGSSVICDNPQYIQLNDSGTKLTIVDNPIVQITTESSCNIYQLDSSNIAIGAPVKANLSYRMGSNDDGKTYPVFLYIIFSGYMASFTTITQSGDRFTITPGNAYRIYIQDNPESTEPEKICIRLASTAVDSSYKCIGGFSCGWFRKTDDLHRPVNSTGEIFGDLWQEEVYQGIIPNSIWTLLHRPKCDPTDMVYLGNNLWGDIYLTTECGSTQKAVYHDTPYTCSFHAEAMNYNWYGLLEKLHTQCNCSKRFPTYEEFCRAAMGTPNRSIADSTRGVSDCATVDCGVLFPTGYYPLAVSSYNVRDLVGTCWKLTSNVFDVESSTMLSEGGSLDSYAWGLGMTTTETQLIINGTNECGMQYLPAVDSMRVLLAGGTYNSESAAGSKAFTVQHDIFTIDEDIGMWLVCESL